jgi:hypothetical protein
MFLMYSYLAPEGPDFIDGALMEDLSPGRYGRCFQEESCITHTQKEKKKRAVLRTTCPETQHEQEASRVERGEVGHLHYLQTLPGKQTGIELSRQTLYLTH